MQQRAGHHCQVTSAGNKKHQSPGHKNQKPSCWWCVFQGAIQHLPIYVWQLDLHMDLHTSLVRQNSNQAFRAGRCLTGVLFYATWWLRCWHQTGLYSLLPKYTVISFHQLHLFPTLPNLKPFIFSSFSFFRNDPIIDLTPLRNPF